MLEDGSFGSLENNPTSLALVPTSTRDGSQKNLLISPRLLLRLFPTQWRSLTIGGIMFQPQEPLRSTSSKKVSTIMAPRWIRTREPFSRADVRATFTTRALIFCRGMFRGDDCRTANTTFQSIFVVINVFMNYRFNQPVSRSGNNSKAVCGFLFSLDCVCPEKTSCLA